MFEELNRIAAMPDGQATTLPGRYYTDPAIYDREVADVLELGWHCVGAVGELPDVGDYLTLTLLGEPLIVVRSDDETVRVLSNVCRHRGMQVAEGAGNAAAFACPYHAWSYRNDGRLAAIPYVDDPWFDSSACALPTIACEVWNGFIYVNLSADPKALVPQLSGLAVELANFESETFAYAHTGEEVWDTNWKCVIENFIEGYHLSVVHPSSLHHLTPTRLAKIGPSDEAFTSFWSYFPDDLPSRGPGAQGLVAENRQRSLLWVMFPTQLVSQNASFLASLNVFPEGVARTRIRWTVSAHPKCSDELIQGAVDMWDTVNEEDRVQLERLQVSLDSRAARNHAGPLVDEDKEGTIHRFHRHLASRLS